MSRSARSRKAARAGFGGLLREGLALTAAAALRNPLAVGGTTAFVVTLAYVSANALWYQPHAHASAYFATRVTHSLPAPERLSRPADPAPRRLEPAARPAPAADDPEPDDLTKLVEQETTASLPTGDPKVRLVQDVLKTLDLYDGAVDGLAGPQTSKAVARYQKILGLPQTGIIDDALMTQLGAGDTHPAVETTGGDAAVPVPVPAPRPRAGAQAPRAETAASTVAAFVRKGDPIVMRIQAGLRAFGHDGIELDGLVGPRTRTAILEFQSLFGLPETGQPDSGLYAKMREVGLAD